MCDKLIPDNYIRLIATVFFLQKTKRFMIYDPKNAGLIFFDILTPPPPPHTSLTTSKNLVSSGGALGGFQKLIGGCVYWTKE